MHFLFRPRDNYAVIYLLKYKRLFYISNFLVTPETWEANIFTYYQGENDQPSAIRRGKESYDAPNERRRFIEEIDTSQTDRYYYDELFLHKEVREVTERSVKPYLEPYR